MGSKPDFQKLWPIETSLKNKPQFETIHHHWKVPVQRCSLASHQLLRRQILCEVRLVIRSRPESHCYRWVHSLQIYPEHVAEAGWIPECHLLKLKVCPDWFSARSPLTSDAAPLQGNKSNGTTITFSARRVANAQGAHCSHATSLNVCVGVSVPSVCEGHH